LSLAVHGAFALRLTHPTVYFDSPPTQGEIAVVHGQRPSHVQMVRQQHDRIDGEWPHFPNDFDGLAQTFPREFLIEKFSPLVRHQREKHHRPVHIIAAIFRHGVSSVLNVNDIVDTVGGVKRSADAPLDAGSFPPVNLIKWPARSEMSIRAHFTLRPSDRAAPTRSS
jgi:hypothetical protein